MTEVSIARARSHFDELVARAARGEHIIIRERDRAMAALISMADLERLEHLARVTWQTARALGQNPELLQKIEGGKLHPAMAAFGLWQDEPELNDLTEQIYANRRQQPGRPEVQW